MKPEEIKKRKWELLQRLELCSDSGEGRKMRKWIEKELEKLDKELRG